VSELIYVPASLLRYRSVEPELSARVIAPGLSGAGVIPKMSVDGGGLWTIAFGEIQLSTPAHRQAWRAINAMCDGGVNKLIIPFVDLPHQPWPIVSGKPLTSYDTIPHDDGSLFSDGSGYVQSVIDAEIVTSAALRSTSLRIRMNYSGGLMGGEHFSIEHPVMSHRMYRIGRVVERDDGDFDVVIRPPLREAVSGGEILDFDAPKSIFEPETPGGLNIGTDIIGMARPSPMLIEGFTSEMLA